MLINANLRNVYALCKVSKVLNFEMLIQSKKLPRKSDKMTPDFQTSDYCANKQPTEMRVDSSTKFHISGPLCGEWA